MELVACVCVRGAVPVDLGAAFYEGQPSWGLKEGKVGAEEMGTCFGCSWQTELRGRNRAWKGLKTRVKCSTWLRMGGQHWVKLKKTKRKAAESAVPTLLWVKSAIAGSPAAARQRRGGLPPQKGSVNNGKLGTIWHWHTEEERSSLFTTACGGK